LQVSIATVDKMEQHPRANFTQGEITFATVKQDPESFIFLRSTLIYLLAPKAKMLYGELQV